jgi:hypothetical protein
VTPGDSKPTGVKSAVKQNASCWQANNCGYGPSITCDASTNNDYVPVKYPNGCKPVPPGPPPMPGLLGELATTSNINDTCAWSQAFQFNANGTVSLALQRTESGHYSHHCLYISQGDARTKGAALLGDCYPESGPPSPKEASQKWQTTKHSDGTVTIKQGDLCVDNNYRPVPPAP